MPRLRRNGDDSMNLLICYKCGMRGMQLNRDSHRACPVYDWFCSTCGHLRPINEVERFAHWEGQRFGALKASEAADQACDNIDDIDLNPPL